MENIFYGICYYYGKNNKDNIKNHLLKFSEIKENKKFIIIITIDSKEPNIHENIRKEILNYVKNISNEEIIILTDYNWGGTIQGLWLAYKHIKNLKLKNSFLCFFEEDFLPFNNNFLKDSFELLENKDYIYIGEHTNNYSETTNYKEISIKEMDKKNCWGLSFEKIYKTHNCHVLNNLYWTDGGYYFSTILKLEKIENKIGIFHKGNQNTKYDHEIDGIILGEIGFPSQIKKYYNFNSIKRKKYFKT